MVIYRKATEKDVKGIGKVLEESYNIDTIEEGIGVFKSETGLGHRYIVAEEKGEIIGIVTWKMHGLPKHELCELDRIAVLHKFKGKGIAKELFHKLMEDANEEYKRHGFKSRKLFILTHADNKRAQAFYKKIGMKHETTLKSHYYKDKDEHVYSIFF